MKHNKVRNIYRLVCVFVGANSEVTIRTYTGVKTGERHWVRKAIKDKKARRWREHMRVVGEAGAARRAWRQHWFPGQQGSPERQKRRAELSAIIEQQREDLLSKYCLCGRGESCAACSRLDTAEVKELRSMMTLADWQRSFTVKI